ncbi:MAG TPA: AAA family ATPase [Polyangiaceae bacterium]|nr:AAA family ATPase [Polyangiaceae bacterium]
MIFTFDEFEFDARKLELRRAGKPLKADPLVLRLLAVLVESAGELVSKEELFAHVWGARAVSENVMTVAMARLRKALGQSAMQREFISTLHGRGYRFVRPVSRREAPLEPSVATARPSLRGAPFVGRERVLERLRIKVEEARRASGGVCAVSGEPGIGKTSVLEVLEKEAAKLGSVVVWGHCREAGDTPPLWPFAELVRGVLERVQLDWSGPRLSGVAGELERLLPEIASLAGPNADGRPSSPDERSATHRMFDAILRVLGVAADQAPLLLILDDLHRADAASLELLHYWVDEIARTRVLLFGALRKNVEPRPPGAAHLAYVLGHRNCERIALERLSEREVSAYVAALLEDPDGVLASKIFARSEGNPFFMAELARALEDSDSSSADSSTLSPAALELVRGRVALLDEAGHGALSWASVIGRSFDLALLQIATGLAPKSMMACIDDAMAREVVVAAPDSRTAFAFGHDLLRAALYDAIAPGDRRARHLKVAEALEQRGAGASHVADLAYHLYAALPEGDLKKTVRYCGEAAAAAAGLFAYADAFRYVRYAREALELLEKPSPRLRFSLVLRQALLARVCALPEFAELVREATQLARAQQNGVGLARAALLMDLHPGFPGLPGSRAALEDALALMGPKDDPVRAPVLARLATSAPSAYDSERAEAQLREACAGMDEAVLSRFTIKNAQLYLRSGPLHRQEGERLMGEIDELCRQHPQILSVPPVLLDMHRAILALQNGLPSAAAAALERSEARCRYIGGRELLWHVERFRLLFRVNSGESAGIEAALSALHARAEHERIIGAAPFCAFDRCVLLSAPASASSLLPALAFDPDDPPAIWSVKVRALAAAGLHAQAESALERVPPDHLCKLPCDRDYLGTLGALASAAVMLDARAHAEALQALLAPYPEQFAMHVSFYCEGSICELLGRIAQALARPSEACVFFERAIAHSEQAGFVASAARARRALAGCSQ